jgi:hypothetical protein
VLANAVGETAGVVLGLGEFALLDALDYCGISGCADGYSRAAGGRR